MNIALADILVQNFPIYPRRLTLFPTDAQLCRALSSFPASPKPLAVRILRIAGQAVGWGLFILMPAMFRPLRPGEHTIGFVADLMFAPRLVNSAWIIVLYYLSYHFIVPKLYLARRYGWLVLTLLGCIFFHLLLNYLIALYHHGPRQSTSRIGNLFGPGFAVYMFLIVLVLSFAIRLYYQWRNAVSEKHIAEVSFLKAQINPHFLFNTLNSIYSLTLTKSDEAPEAVVKLSGMMRYTVTETGQDFVALEKELGYIRDYISLQRLRLPDDVKVYYEIVGDTSGKRIAPFILIPFIENAFKYGVNPEEDSHLLIRITVIDHELELQVSNNKVRVAHSEELRSGVGLENTRKRLHLLYPGRYTLTVNDRAYDFNVSLTLELL